jgi:hypothetical protein
MVMLWAAGTRPVSAFGGQLPGTLGRYNAWGATSLLIRPRSYLLSTENLAEFDGPIGIETVIEDDTSGSVILEGLVAALLAV